LDFFFRGVSKKREEKILGRLGESGGKIEIIVEAFDGAENKGPQLCASCCRGPSCSIVSGL
jgi:hypothetical protein